MPSSLRLCQHMESYFNQELSEEMHQVIIQPSMQIALKLTSKQNNIKMHNPHLHNISLVIAVSIKKYFYLAKIKHMPVFNSPDKHHPI